MNRERHPNHLDVIHQFGWDRNEHSWQVSTWIGAIVDLWPGQTLSINDHIYFNRPNNHTKTPIWFYKWVDNHYLFQILHLWFLLYIILIISALVLSNQIPLYTTALIKFDDKHQHLQHFAFYLTEFRLYTVDMMTWSETMSEDIWNNRYEYNKVAASMVLPLYGGILHNLYQAFVLRYIPFYYYYKFSKYFILFLILYIIKSWRLPTL